MPFILPPYADKITTWRLELDTHADNPFIDHPLLQAGETYLMKGRNIALLILETED